MAGDQNSLETTIFCGTILRVRRDRPTVHGYTGYPSISSVVNMCLHVEPTHADAHVPIRICLRHTKTHTNSITTNEKQ